MNLQMFSVSCSLNYWNEIFQPYLLWLLTCLDLISSFTKKKHEFLSYDLKYCNTELSDSFSEFQQSSYLKKVHQITVKKPYHFTS